MKQVWEFFSYNYNSNLEKNQGEVTCVQPSKTKTWKCLSLELQLDENMETIGYRIKTSENENNPFPEAVIL